MAKALVVWISYRGSIDVGIELHTENEHEIRIISFRKATKRESQIYLDELQN